MVLCEPNLTSDHLLAGPDDAAVNEGAKTIAAFDVPARESPDQ
jgi:hypothetical protein